MEWQARRSLVELPIIEAFGAQEIFIHGSQAVMGEDDVVIISYVERRVGDVIERHEVLRCHMTRARYEANLLRAFERYRGAAGGH